MATPKGKKAQDTVITQKQKQQAQGKKLFDRLEPFLEKHEKKIFWGLFGLFSFLCIFQLDARLSGANDDATYIEAGYNYAKDYFNYFYTSQAPLYPMFLAFPIMIFGVNIIVLKLTSLIFSLLFFYFMYRAYRSAIPYLVLFPVLLITSINYYFHYYASHTFVEAFFIFLQGIFFLAAFRLLKRLDEKGMNLKDSWKNWALTMFMLMLLILAKNAGVAVIGGVLAYFMLKKQFKTMLIALGLFMATYAIWSGVKTLIWGKVENYNTQFTVLLQKDAYDASKGYEDFDGFVERFKDNSYIYISNRFMEILGLKTDDDKGLTKPMQTLGFHLLNDEVAEKMPILVSGKILFFYFLFLGLGLWAVFRSKNNYLLFTTLYAMAIIGATFIITQPFWAQHRYMYIFVPYLMMVILYGIYSVVRKVDALQYVYLLFIVILFGTGISMLNNKIKKQSKILASATGLKATTPYATRAKLFSAFWKGDKYFGYTPDWANYLKMCEWVSDSIPDSVNVGCRKPGEAFIYGKGRHFFAMHKAEITDPDSNLSRFEKAHVKYIILANLRINPEKADGNIINTIHRILQPIDQKYPGKLRPMHKEGEAEPADLIEIVSN